MTRGALSATQFLSAMPNELHVPHIIAWLSSEHPARSDRALKVFGGWMRPSE
jgi:hypothetical protein